MAKKDAFYYYKAQWFKEPFIKIAQERFANRVNPTTIKVYSNQQVVSLSVNEDTYKTYSQDGVFRFEGIRLRKGKNVIRACTGIYTDEVVFYGVDTPDPSYTYVDPNPGINVKNWFTDMVEEEKLFPKGRLSVRETVETLLKYEEAMAVMEEYKIAKQMRERGGLMPLEQILRFMKREFSDERCKELNARLTAIEK